MSAGWLQYLGGFLGSAVLCAFLTPIAMKIAVKSGALDHPGDHKSHKSPMPYLGGMAIVAAFGVAVAGAAAAGGCAVAYLKTRFGDRDSIATICPLSTTMVSPDFIPESGLNKSFSSNLRMPPERIPTVTSVTAERTKMAPITKSRIDSSR